MIEVGNSVQAVFGTQAEVLKKTRSTMLCNGRPDIVAETGKCRTRCAEIA